MGGETSLVLLYDGVGGIFESKGDRFGSRGEGPGRLGSAERTQLSSRIEAQ